MWSLTGRGNFVEIQGTGEESYFTRDELDGMLVLAQKGIEELLALQKNITGDETFHE
jgi:ribonuclease PH